MKNADVFISYHMDSCRHIVHYLSGVLENRGVSCWFAPRDCEEQFAGTIVGAIRKCKVFLMILNKNSSNSKHCLSEVAIAFDRLSKNEEITLLPFRVDDCQLSDALFYYLNTLHIHDGSLPPELERLHELADRICVMLQKTPCADSVIADSYTRQEKTYQLVGKIKYPDTSFVGRKQEIAAIHQQMACVDNKIFLVGMGGLGKSEITKMYLKTYATDYDVVVWVDFSHSLCQTIAGDETLPVKGLIRSDYPGDDDRAYMRRKLEILKTMTGKKILFILDNFDVLQDPDLEDFCSGSYGVIFTTRNHGISHRIRELEILPMEDEEELMALFRMTYQAALPPSKEETVRKILRHFNGHTLSVRLMAQIMKGQRLAPEKMLSMLQSGLSGMAQMNNKAADRLSEELDKLFHLSDFTAEETFLMENLALIPNSGIGVELFYELCKLDDYDIIDGLIAKSWVLHDVILDRVHLHPLISDLMLRQLLQEPDNCNTYVQSLIDRCEGLVQNSYEEKLEQSMLIQCVVDRLPVSHSLYGKALLSLAENNYNLSFFDKARDNCLLILQQIPQPEYHAQAYYHLSHIATNSGNHRECIELAEKGYAIADSLTPEQIALFRYDRRWGFLSRIAQSCMALGDYDKAVDNFGKVYRFTLERAEKNNFDKASGSSHAWSEFHLANALFMAGRYSEAEPMARACASRFKQYDDLWSYAYAVNQVAYYEARNGNLQAALRCSQESWDLHVSRLGEQHIGLANKLFSRGDLYAIVGDKENAIACWNQAIARYEDLGLQAKTKAVREAIQALEEGPFSLIITR